MFTSSMNVKNYGDVLKQLQSVANQIDILYEHIRLFSGDAKVMKKATYDEYYRNFFNDIKIETDPIDALIITVDEEDDGTAPASEFEEMKPIYEFNKEAKEYVTIQKRMEYDNFTEDVPNTNEVKVALANNTYPMEDMIHDLYVHFLTTKYIELLSRIQQAGFSVGTPLVEDVVLNVTLDNLKNGIHKSTINKKKVQKYLNNLVPVIGLSTLDKFYTSDEFLQSEYAIEFKEAPTQILFKLASNIDCIQDASIVIAVYLIMSIAMGDFDRKTAEESKCAQYVREVISKL